MREVINISLPPAMAKEVKKAVKTGKYASTSEFFRELLNYWHSEELLFRDLQQSMKEYKQGKGRVLKSFKDLR